MNLHVRAVITLALGLLACNGHRAAAAPGSRPRMAACAPTAESGSPRTIVVISDLHLGFGPQPKAWHAFEDFRWADEFEAFVRAIDERVAGPVDLVVAGDLFELWQWAEGDCPPAGKSDLGCTAEDARIRLERILAVHAREIGALSAFASHDDNRLVVLAGNHDAALLYPEVEALLAARMIGARYAFEPDAWMPRDCRLLVEHGHQVKKDANYFDEWPALLSDGGKPRVRRTAGEDFVRAVYNQYEAKYPIIDNITDEGTGVALVIDKEGWGAGAQGILGILKHILLESTRSQKLGWLKPGGGPPEWDLGATRARGTAVWKDVLPPDDPGRRLFSAGATALDPKELSDSELLAVCDAAEELRLADPPTAALVAGCARKASGTLGPGGGGGAEGETLGQIAGWLRSRDRTYATYLSKRRGEITAPGAAPFAFYVLGHTHGAEAFSPMPGSASWQPRVVNSGAWQRVTTPDELRQRSSTGKLEASVLTLSPEDLSPAYDVVIRDVGADPRLACWRKGGSGWKLRAERCH